MIYILSLLLLISTILNGVLVHYSIKAARKLFVVSANMEGLQEIFLSFRHHLEGLHESEIYYGDQSLQNLIQHSRDVLLEIDKCEDIYTLVLEDDELSEAEDAKADSETNTEIVL